jgi:hypothetical protein
VTSTQFRDADPVTVDVETAPPLYGRVLSCGNPSMSPFGDAVPACVAAEPG